MRYMLSALLLVAVQSVYADAYKCKGAGGQVVIASTPCDSGYQASSVVSSDSADSNSYRQAQSDLQRQKAWLANRDAERGGNVGPSVGIVSIDSNNHDAIYACLMKVAAVQNLTPVIQAQRKVSCYSGTVGLIGECQSSVAATMGLTTGQENAIKGNCR